VDARFTARSSLFATVALVSLGLPALVVPAVSAPKAVAQVDPAGARFAAAPVAADSPSRAYDEFIVKFRPGSGSRFGAGRARALDEVGGEVGLDLKPVRTLATGATLVRSSQALRVSGQESLLAEFHARDDVVYAAPDEVVHPDSEPNDPNYVAQQWHYRENGARLPHAWSFSRGAAVDVAILDTGRTAHPDLVWSGGYDFISEVDRARDGDGRDPNPADPGDWEDVGECDATAFEGSSWHGTHVGGTAGARWGSTTAGAPGVAPAARIIPVRVLGRCGGKTSDVVDAVAWASGGTVSGVPAIANRAEVVNMSLGGNYSSLFECNNAFQDVANDARSRGTLVVVSAGNDDKSTENGTYTACDNVVVVGATDASGGRSVWGSGSGSNHGAEVDVSAPGTNVFSAVNVGARAPAAAGYASWNGTSMAAPHVAGLAALVMSAYPDMTPAQVEAALKRTARPLNDGCSDCGSGIVDATRLFKDLAGPVTRNTSLSSMFNSYADLTGYAARCDDWSGGDGTQSVRLPSGRRAWFFSDSYLGDPTIRANGFHTSGLRNAIVVQDGSSLRTITGGNTCKEKSTDVDFWSRYAKTPVREAGNAFYWGADGMVVGSNIVKFWWRNEPTPDGWWMETHTAVTVQPVSDFDGSVSSPTPQLVNPITPYENHPILWGISLLEADGTVYIYGSASMEASKERQLFVARSAKADLATPSQWQYRTSTGAWSGSQADAAPITTGFEPTMSYSVKKMDGMYWLLQREPGINGGDIVAHPSTTAWGFTNNAVTLYSAPEGNHAASDYLLHYDVRVHDGINSDPDDLVLSYNVNTSAVSIGCRGLNDHDSSIYRPRFLNVPAEKLDPADARPVTNTSSSGFTTPSPVTAGVDNQWYDAWAYSGVLCPPLVKSTTLSATTDPDGDVHLRWNGYGRDMWYWVESRDATANTPWKRSDYWATGPAFDLNPITSTAVNGHTFEYRIVPFANGPGGRTAPTSNTVSVAARVALPAAPTGVSATTPLPKDGTVFIRWSKVTYPHAHNFYRVFYWDKTAGQTRANAWATAWYGETATWASLNLARGHTYGFDVQAQNIAGLGPRSASVTAVP
jgi:serine protease